MDAWLMGLFLVSSVIFLLLFVARSKLVPDFALTIHFLHLVTTTLYTHSIPKNLLWWVLQCASSALMTFVGMWACQHRELEPISFGGLGGGSSNSGQPSSSQQPADDGQPESRFGRGRGREHGVQGEEYEMGDMKARGNV